MKNFLRAVKYALRYRWRLVISVLCAFVAAVLFGLNFSAVYPLLQMMMKDREPKALPKPQSTLPLFETIEAPPTEADGA